MSDRKPRNELGTPLAPHVACPTCDNADEVGSHFDSVWCYRCGWRGSLTKQRAATTTTQAITLVQMSCGYVENDEDAKHVPTCLADLDPEVQ